MHPHICLRVDYDIVVADFEDLIGDARRNPFTVGDRGFLVILLPTTVNMAT